MHTEFSRQGTFSDTPIMSLFIAGHLTLHNSNSNIANIDTKILKCVDFMYNF